MASQTKQLNLYSQIDDAITWIDFCCTKILKTGIPAYITVSNEPPEPVRSSNENRKFHTIMNDIWMQGVVEFDGDTYVLKEEYTDTQCKTFLLIWFINTLEEMGEKIPEYAKIEPMICIRTKQVYNQRGSTTKYSDKFCRLLCQFLWSTGAEIGVKFTDPATREYEKIMHSGEIK